MATKRGKGMNKQEIVGNLNLCHGETTLLPLNTNSGCPYGYRLYELIDESFQFKDVKITIEVINGKEVKQWKS